ncbi:hypothetical protein [Enterobacteria phage VT2-Sakai]|uniref:Uncharacterized protein H0107 n=1 Tax=Enterobacteria phage VT2-Sa TaxID=97081 RepID=Q9KXE3_BPVT2|nr:hypothetical protein [Enterobacteria phage VT2-Sakai]
MTTQISVETLSPITHNQIPVITTELLAQLYGTEPVRIRQNHHENKVRFVEGKHFFKVVGNDLKELRVALNYSQNLRVTLSNSQNLQPSLRGLQISPKARSLILWTERGAARHAKRLETDQGCVRKTGRLLFQPVREKYWQTREEAQRAFRKRNRQPCMAVGLCQPLTGIVP